MLTYLPLSSCSIQSAVDIWNKGFEDYFVTMRFDEKQFLTHLTNTDISPALSFIGQLDNGTAVGIVLNGIRKFQGKKIAWNGGTGIAKAYRGSGYGKLMINEALRIYKENNVDIATLEVLEQNKPALYLYKKMGYETVQTLHFHTLPLTTPPTFEITNKYKVSISDIHAIQKLSFWNTWTPWQTQKTNQSSGYSAILWDDQKNPLSYAIFDKTYDQDGNYIRCTLKHCEISPFTKENKQTIYACLLAHVFPFFNREQIQISSSFICSTYNLLMDLELSKVLQGWGFERKLGQVWMQIVMK